VRWPRLGCTSLAPRLRSSFQNPTSRRADRVAFSGDASRDLSILPLALRPGPLRSESLLLPHARGNSQAVSLLGAQAECDIAIGSSKCSGHCVGIYSFCWTSPRPAARSGTSKQVREGPRSTPSPRRPGRLHALSITSGCRRFRPLAQVPDHGPLHSHLVRRAMALAHRRPRAASPTMSPDTGPVQACFIGGHVRVWLRTPQAATSALTLVALTADFLSRNHQRPSSNQCDSKELAFLVRACSVTKNCGSR